MKTRAFALLAILLAAAFSAQAAPININLLDPASLTLHGTALFNTGVSDSGAALANSAVDTHYRWHTAPSANTLATGGASTFAWRTGWPVGGPWVGNTVGVTGQPDSVWIAPVAGVGTDYAGGNFAVTTTINLTGMPSWYLDLGGDIWTDNFTSSVQVFGPAGGLIATHAINPGANAGEQFWDNNQRSFAFNLNGLAPGTYTVQFNMTNIPQATGNPAGLKVRWTTGNAIGVPEPGAYALMATAGLVLFLISRRRRSRAA